ncbi:MAG: ATP-binding cassette domain-containing protein, partial [Pseudomonadota bacterium]
LLMSVRNAEARNNPRELAAVVRHIIDNYDKNEALRTFETVEGFPADEIDGICGLIDAQFSEAEKHDLILNLCAIVFQNGISNEKNETINKIAKKIRLPETCVQSLFSIFSDDAEKLKSNPSILVLGDGTDESDIPLSGCKGRIVFYKTPDNTIKIISLKEDGFYLNGRYINSNFFGLNFDSTRKFHIDNYDIVFNLEFIESLFENKRLNKKETIWITGVGEELTKCSTPGETLIARIEWEKNHGRIVSFTPNQKIVVSGKKYEQNSIFFIGEKIEFIGFRNEIFISRPPKKHIDNSRIASEKVYTLNDYDKSFDVGARLVCRPEEDGFTLRVTGDGLFDAVTLPGPDNTTFLRAGESITIGGLFIFARDRDIAIHAVKVENITVNNLTARYPSKSYPSIRDISFSLNSGEMMAIMGPSGSGKSSMIKAFIGNMIIERGELMVNGQTSRDGFLSIKRLLGYATQDDILDDSLTVGENLYFYQKLKSKGTQSDRKIGADIDDILAAFKVFHKKNKRVASKETKLSGGQRRRVNLAMELLNDPEVLILDEPTSGLSSQDSEQIVSFLKDLTRKGKTVMVVIHQPSSIIYKMFDKVLILDDEGESLFFGDPLEALALFNVIHSGPRPSFADLDRQAGDDLYPELLLSAQGEEFHDYWRSFKLVSSHPDNSPLPRGPREGPAAKDISTLGKKTTLRDTFVELPYQIRRQLLSKSRDRLNRWLSFIVPPALGILIAFVFRFTPDGETYSIAANKQYPYFLFLIVITGTFLGLMASVFEILKDEAILKRESLSDVSIGGYLFAKFLVLLWFGIIQSVLFLTPAHLILGVQHMFLVNAGIMVLVTAIGIGFGLLFATLTPSVLAAYNLVPLILIPQIILGGGFLPYQKMGGALYCFERGASILTDDQDKTPWSPNKNRAPVIARLLPASWAFEFLMTANYHFHPIRLLKDEKQFALDMVYQKYKNLKEVQGSLSETDRQQKKKEVDAVTASYNQKIETNKKTMNEEVQKNGSGLTPLERGDFLAQQHNYFTQYDGHRLFDEIFSKTWFKDFLVLLLYLSSLYLLGLYRVKQVIARRS